MRRERCKCCGLRRGSESEELFWRQECYFRGTADGAERGEDDLSEDEYARW